MSPLILFVLRKAADAIFRPDFTGAASHLVYLGEWPTHLMSDASVLQRCVLAVFCFLGMCFYAYVPLMLLPSMVLYAARDLWYHTHVNWRPEGVPPASLTDLPDGGGNPFHVLGLERTASSQEAAAAGRREMFRYHPDKTRRLQGEHAAAAARKYALACAAHKLLSEPDSRAKYEDAIAAYQLRRKVIAGVEASARACEFATASWISVPAETLLLVPAVSAVPALLLWRLARRIVAWALARAGVLYGRAVWACVRSLVLCVFPAWIFDWLPHLIGRLLGTLLLPLYSWTSSESITELLFVLWIAGIFFESWNPRERRAWWTLSVRAAVAAPRAAYTTLPWLILTIFNYGIARYVASLHDYEPAPLITQRAGDNSAASMPEVAATRRAAANAIRRRKPGTAAGTAAMPAAVSAVEAPVVSKHASGGDVRALVLYTGDLNPTARGRSTAPEKLPRMAVVSRVMLADGSEDITFTWTPKGGSLRVQIDRFVVSYCAPGTSLETSLVSTMTTGCTWRAAADLPGGVYRFTVRATNSWGPSPPSEPSSVTLQRSIAVAAAEGESTSSKASATSKASEPERIAARLRKELKNACAARNAARIALADQAVADAPDAVAALLPDAPQLLRQAASCLRSLELEDERAAAARAQAAARQAELQRAQAAVAERERLARLAAERKVEAKRAREEAAEREQLAKLEAERQAEALRAQLEAAKRERKLALERQAAVQRAHAEAAALEMRIKAAKQQQAAALAAAPPAPPPAPPRAPPRAPSPPPPPPPQESPQAAAPPLPHWLPTLAPLPTSLPAAPVARPPQYAPPAQPVAVPLPVPLPVPVPAASQSILPPPPQAPPADRPAATGSRECVVCLDAMRGALFMPCRHFVTCLACANALMAAQRPCPMCCAPLATYIEIFES